jgi:polysaccharide biosynthesis/export protein
MKLFNSILLLVAFCSVSIGAFAQNNREPKKPSATVLAVASVVEKPVVESKPTESAAMPEKKDNEVRENRYRIGLLDQIEVVVSRHPELSMVVSVNEQGMISLPRSEKLFAVVCRTESELQQEITNEYKKFLVKPFVNVRVTQQNSQPFAVIGAVEKPGNFFLNRRVTLLELISYASGAKGEKKAGRKVQIARVGGVSGCVRNEEASVDDFDTLFETYSLQDVYDLKKNPVMRPGDIVRVLEADEIYVVGNVVKPQTVVLKDGLTVSQAIAAAGGIMPSTKAKQILIRRKLKGESIELLVDLEKINKKQMPDVALLPDDIVDVPIDKLKSGLGGVLKVLTQGIPSILARTAIP